MNKTIWIRILFIVLGLASLAVSYFIFIVGYLFGPLAFNPPDAKPHYIVDMFLYKDYFIIGLILLFSLIAAIMSFVVAFKPDGRLIRKVLLSYSLVIIAFLSQILWSTFQAGGTPSQRRETERLFREILQEQEKARYDALQR